MPNPIFRLKKFRLLQDRCAMKVTADACLLGAVAVVSSEQPNILDIGAGTGLLSLMAAQRFPSARVVAVEIDPTAAAQARANIAASPWVQRILVVASSIQHFAQNHANEPENYPLFSDIWVNPPFFDNSTRSKTPTKALARHTDSMPFDELWAAANTLLADEGAISILLPTDRREAAEITASLRGFSPVMCLYIAARPDTAAKRVILTLKKTAFTQIKAAESCLYIRSDAEHYSPEYIDLMRDFYLFL